MSIIDDTLKLLGVSQKEKISVLKILVFKYLDTNYNVVKYNYKSYYPPKDGCLLFDKVGNEVTWGNFNRDLAVIFSIHVSDAKYCSAEWFRGKAKIVNQANQGFREV